MIVVDDFLQFVNENASSSDISQCHYYEHSAKDFIDNRSSASEFIPTSIE